MQSLIRYWWRRISAPSTRGAAVRLIGVAVPALVAATAIVWLLEEELGVRSAAPVYLLAVVATALVSGTLGALATAVVGMLLYDYLFTEPLHTFLISDAGEWLDLVLLLFVGLVVGQLTALERARALTAESREREARELFLISRALATRSSTAAVLPEIAAPLATSSSMTALWITLGANDAAERAVAEWGTRPAAGGLFWQLRRFPGERPAQWIRIHPPTAGRSRPAIDQALDVYRVRIEAGARPLGSIWAARERSNALPDRTATRLMSAAADQIGQAIAQDQLAAEASAADVARQSDALKTALLQSVSHDLRTPLATIRAAAGTLQPDSDLDADGRRASASAIEREVERLDRLVANLLDLGRIEAGELRADLDVFELDDLVGRTVDRFAPRLTGHDVRLDVAPIPVLVDPVFLDETLTNLLDNALKFTGPDSMIRIHAARDASGPVHLVVEDDGAGVPTDLLPRLFEKFFRAPPSGPRARSSRPGTGIGLAVVRGLMQAMGGSATARASELGGLAVELELPLAALPAELLEAAAS